MNDVLLSVEVHNINYIKSSFELPEFDSTFFFFHLNKNQNNNSPLNFCALVCSVEYILLIASLVFFSMTCRECEAIFCSMAALQHDPDDDTSQYRSLISVNGQTKEKISS